MKKTAESEVLRCSFCNKDQNDVRKLIAGPTVFICDECVDVCNDIIADDRRVEGRAYKSALPVPHEIKKFLDEYVIGQDTAKKKLAVAVYNHYKRIEIAKQRGKNEVELTKSNILLIGPPARARPARPALARLSPSLHDRDAHPPKRLRRRGRETSSSTAAARRHIEKCRKASSTSTRSTRSRARTRTPITATSRARRAAGAAQDPGLDVATCPQGAASPPQSSTRSTPPTSSSSRGAFVGRQDHRAPRGKKSLGFRTDAKSTPTAKTTLNAIQPTDLIKYGLIPEFVGRLPVIGTLHDLDKPALIEILTAPKNAIIRQYQRMFDYESVKLRFTDDALEPIASWRSRERSPVRAGSHDHRDLMLDLMYNSLDEEVEGVRGHPGRRHGPGEAHHPIEKSASARAAPTLCL